MSKTLNNEKLLRALSDVDDKYINEAMNPESSGKAKVSFLRNPAVIGSIAAISIALIGGIFLLKNSDNKSEERVQNFAASEDLGRDSAQATYAGIDFEYSEGTLAAVEEAAMAPSNDLCVNAESEDSNIRSVNIAHLPEELSEATLTDYEYSDGFVRTSYFDESGELLLEIECNLESNDESFQNYVREEASSGVTFYLDDNIYIGASFERDGNYYLIRTPMGVSYETLMSIVNQI